jgi:hypothetical protein
MPDLTDPATFGKGGGSGGKSSAGGKSSGGSSGAAPHWLTINGHHVKVDATGKVVAGHIVPGETHDAHGRPIGIVSAPRARQFGHSLDGKRSIGDVPARSRQDQARDKFSRAKLDHKAARAAHKAAPSADTAAHLVAARKTLGEHREGYRAASGGKIEGRPLDAHDPRVRAVQASRPLAHYGRETSPHIPARERRENRVLLKVEPPVSVVAHHHGEPAPKFRKEDVEDVKRAAKAYEKGDRVAPSDLAHEARYADRKASEDATRDNHAHLIYDRISGTHAVHHDSDFKLNAGRHESFRSGRLVPLKTYGTGALGTGTQEIPLTQHASDHMKGGERATRESNVARKRAAFDPATVRDLDKLPGNHPRRLQAGFSDNPTEGVWSPLVAFGKGGGPRASARPAAAHDGQQGAPGGATPASSTGRSSKRQPKGSTKLHGAGNCGTGKGGFRPGNTCGKSGRAKLAEDIRKARASADQHGGHAALRDKVKALKMHRRDHEHAIADEHAGQLRAGLRTGEHARRSKIKAETVAHAHAEVRAAHSVQRARNAKDAKRTPVHEIKGEEHWSVKNHRERIEALKADRARLEETFAKGNADKLKAHREEAWDKSYDESLTKATRRKWGKEYEKRHQAYVTHKNDYEIAEYRLAHSTHAKDIAEHEGYLAKAIAEHGDGTTRINHAEHQANHPDLIAPGPITERIAKYRVGDAKLKAIDAIGKHYDARATALAGTKARMDKAIDHGVKVQGRMIDKATDIGSPELQARMDKIRARIDRVDVARNRVIDARMNLVNQQREDIENILKVDRPIKIESTDVPADYSTNSGPLAPPTTGTKLADRKARKFLEKTVARGDDEGMSVMVGEGSGYRAHCAWDGKHIQADINERPDVMVHEYGHALDVHVKIGGVSANTRSQEFLKHRVGDEPTIDMKQRFGTGDPGEMGRKDKFQDAMGTEYSAYYTGKDYGDRASEVTSMGIQHFYKDPVGFAKRDPEYTRYIMGYMDGSLR